MLISADSHVVEPAEIWEAGLPSRFRDVAPRAFRDPTTQDWMFGGPGLPSKLNLTTMMSPGVMRLGGQRNSGKDQPIPPATRDPQERLLDLWKDNCMADVVYSTCAFELFQIKDIELQAACFAIANDWLGEYCSADLDRLAGVGLLAPWDMKAAVKELERCKALGLKSVGIWATPPNGKLSDPSYDPLWEAAADLGIVLAIHVLTGETTVGDVGNSPGSALYFQSAAFQELARSVAEVIGGGVFDRYPKLKFVAAEGGIEFVSGLNASMDTWATLRKFDLQRKPSEYFGENVFCSFVSDPIGLNNLKFFDIRTGMWSSDYPHLQSTWPQSLEASTAEFADAGLNPDQVRMLTIDNAARVYGFDIDVVSQPSPLIRDKVSAPA